MPRRWKYEGSLGKAFSPVNSIRSRGGTWTRIAKHHKAVHPQCAVCGAITNLETDHVVPLHRGGSDDWTNLQSLCHDCHARKSAKERGT